MLNSNSAAGHVAYACGGCDCIQRSKNPPAECQGCQVCKTLVGKAKEMVHVKTGFGETYLCYPCACYIGQLGMEIWFKDRENE